MSLPGLPDPGSWRAEGGGWLEIVTLQRLDITPGHMGAQASRSHNEEALQPFPHTGRHLGK